MIDCADVDGQNINAGLDTMTGCCNNGGLSYRDPNDGKCFNCPSKQLMLSGHIIIIIMLLIIQND